ncbi:MAG: CoA transferase [Chloroflexi bacterium]|nr:CoA transferase [Chloroflexota bacterium]
MNDYELSTEKQALAGVKVLDFGWALVGSLTGKHLANHGAEVIRVETVARLDLQRTNRHISKASATNPDDRPWFAYCNSSKYGITLNLKHLRARGVIDRLIRWADVVNENFTPGTMGKLGLGYEDMKKVKPDIIMIGASIFGQTGPLAAESGVNSTANAWSGRTNLAGWPDREPVSPASANYGDEVLPFLNAMAIIAALDYKRRTGKGQYVDVGMVEVCAQQITPAFLSLQANGRLLTRTGNRIANAAPHGVFPCIGDDRWCAIAVFTDEEWQAFCHVLGDPSWAKEHRFANLSSRKENEDELEKLVAVWTMRHSAEEVMRMMQAAGVAAGVVQNTQEVMDHDPQLKERGFLVPLKHPVLGVFRHPTPPYKLLKTRDQVRTSPCLGEHTYYVCTKLLGITDEEFVDLERDGVFQ